MRVNVIHADINPCGGAEQVAITTVQALVDMGFDVDLTLAAKPDIDRIKKVFGDKRITAVFSSVSEIRQVGSLLAEEQDGAGARYDLILNTHGDILPFYDPTFSKTNAITYCHYPVAVEQISKRDTAYIQRMVDLGLVPDEDYSSIITKREGKDVWTALLERFFLMIRNSTVLTNSSFSRKAILDMMRQERFPATGNAGIAIDPPTIIPPAVSAEEYRKAALSSTERTNMILVISRIHPSKELENAVLLARMLRKNGIAASITIAGSLVPDAYSIQYLRHLKAMISSCKLSDNVRIMLDVPQDALKLLMRKSKVYFHPMRAEPFGISIVEAMSAGLIPAVPDTGGHTDFVPNQYAYSSLDHAAKIISEGLGAAEEERTIVSDMASEFSNSNYIRRLQAVVKYILAARHTPVVPPESNDESNMFGHSMAA